MLLRLPLPSSNLLVSFVKSDRPLAASGTPGIWPSKKGYQMKIKLSLKADWTVARDSHIKTGGQVSQVSQVKARCSPTVAIGNTAIRGRRFMRKSRFI